MFPPGSPDNNAKMAQKKSQGRNRHLVNRIQQIHGGPWCPWCRIHGLGALQKKELGSGPDHPTGPETVEKVIINQCLLNRGKLF